MSYIGGVDILHNVKDHLEVIQLALLNPEFKSYPNMPERIVTILMKVIEMLEQAEREWTDD